MGQAFVSVYFRSVVPRAEAGSSRAAGAGEPVADFEFPEPDPAPLTAIAWRVGHVCVGIFGMRNASHFGGPPMDYVTFDWAGTAKEALAQLDSVYAGWVAGVKSLDEAALARPCGDAEGEYGHLSMAALVLHINREEIGRATV